MDGTEHEQGWRAWLGLERKADLVVFVIALLVVGGLAGMAAFESKAIPPSWLSAVAMVCLIAMNWITRGNRYLLKKRLDQIHQAFAQGQARRMSRAARLLTALAFGLLLIRLWLALHG